MTVRPRTSLTGVLLVASATVAAAQVPAGGEFRVSPVTAFDGRGASPAVGPGGEFVVAWSHRADAVTQYDILGRRFDPFGAAVGAEFAINTYTTGRQSGARVAIDGRGRFVVVWSGYGVYGRRYDEEGAPQGPEFQISTPGIAYPGRDGTIAMDRAGRSLAAWSGDSAGPNYPVVLARRYDSAGGPQGAPFTVSAASDFRSRYPGVGVDADGNYVVVWSAFEVDLFTRRMFGRRYDASGAPLGSAFPIGSPTTSVAHYPVIAMEPGGDFAVAWHDWRTSGALSDIVAQRFFRDGTKRGSEFTVNTYTTGHQLAPAAVGFAGGFVVAWTGHDQDGSDYGMFAQRVASDGSLRGAEFQVNTYTTGRQGGVALGADEVGNFVVTWTSRNQGTPGYAVFAQRFGGLVPAALAVDPAGNGVLDPGETVEVRPAWRNVSLLPQTFNGSLISLTGPPGATYAISDPTGSYGTLANGAQAACADCYGVSVGNPPGRPATHWDATAEEAILPDAQGQRKLWALHVGESFSDVGVSSPFYRFVETLLHAGVTTGCTATTYCPSASTTREQMAVFVLVAKEGAGYRPTACAAPFFSDVPASSPFCPWVEELARRGVVTGCGGGAYCPSAAVSREQMAVFVLATKEPGVAPPPCATPSMFADVPASSPFCPWIEELARRGVVTGCGGGSYCPAAAVTREQMGVFIGVTFGLGLYGP